MEAREVCEAGVHGGLRCDDGSRVERVRTVVVLEWEIGRIFHLILYRPINNNKREGKRMAHRLARIFGTEEDKVNCAFYYKIGACRHGDRCTRLHNKPLLSQTVLLKNMYVNPAPALALAEGKS